MKRVLPILFAMCCSIAAAQETANDIAVTVIQKYFTPESGSTVRSRLNALMVTDAVSEESRICYAVTLIDNKIHLARLLKSSMAPIPHEAELLKMREMLVKRLQEFPEHSSKKPS